MKIIDPSVEILTVTENVLQLIEAAGRTCYKSEDRITPDSAPKFVKMLINRGHEAMLEHSSVTVRFICDRGVSHELVRHRIASFAQESTRYCNYGGNGLTVIRPCWFQSTCGKMNYAAMVASKAPMAEWDWVMSMTNAEQTYKRLLDSGWTPQQARSVLPNSLKTEVVMTANLREWRHFLKLRTAEAAHPQMRQVADMLLIQLQERIPVIFDDIKEEQNT